MIKLKVDFYADTFRSCELEISERLEKMIDSERRLIISDIIARHLKNRGIHWNEKRIHVWRTGSEVNRDSFGIGIITCKRI